VFSPFRRNPQASLLTTRAASTRTAALDRAAVILKLLFTLALPRKGLFDNKGFSRWGLAFPVRADFLVIATAHHSLDRVFAA